MAKAVSRKIQVGQRCKGVVKNLTKFGAFVDIDELIWFTSYLKWVGQEYLLQKEYVKAGDEIEVEIKAIEEDKLVLILSNSSKQIHGIMF